jgi:hypothetical protein
MLKYLTSSLLMTLLIAVFTAKAQSPIIDTIPFTTDRQLLVFSALINGIPVDVAFDTGASLGVANDNTVTSAGLKRINDKMTVSDANARRAKLRKVQLENLVIGSHKFSNVRSVWHSMEFLQCHRFYLLGMDVIGKVNWCINFDRSELYISQTPFPTSGLQSLAVGFKGGRPFTNLAVGGGQYANVLIDMGYVGIADMQEDTHLNGLHAANRAGGNTVRLSTNSGLLGRSNADTAKRLVADTLLVGGVAVGPIPIDIEEKSTSKIGVGFFTHYTHLLVLNHSSKSYHVAMRNAPLAVPQTVDAIVSYVDGKLQVTSVLLALQGQVQGLAINEVVLSIDGKTAADFGSACNYLLWWFGSTKNAAAIIKKMDGDLLSIRRYHIAP